MYTNKEGRRLSLKPMFLGLFILFSLIIQAQDSLAFPQAWVGIWQGELEIFDAQGLKQNLPMELHIQPRDSADHYDWWIIYGEDKEAGKRAYQLKPKDKEKGIWVVDEKNTIALESYFIHDKLWSWYDVMGSLILVSNEVQGDEMIFEIVAGKSEPISITGNQEFEGEAIPEVKTFPINVMQRALLLRQ